MMKKNNHRDMTKILQEYIEREIMLRREVQTLRQMLFELQQVVAKKKNGEK